MFYKHLCNLKWRRGNSHAVDQKSEHIFTAFHLAGKGLSHSGSQVSSLLLIPRDRSSRGRWVKTPGFCDWWRKSVGDLERLSYSLWMFVFLLEVWTTNPYFRLHIFIIYLFKDFMYLFLEKGRERERERNINVWLPLPHPLLGTWPTTQACVLTGNWTSGL